MKNVRVVPILTATAMASAMASPMASAMTSAGLGVHEHGVADLAIAVEGERVDLILTAPTGDLVGLERAPATVAERDGIRERIAAIEAHTAFAFPGGRCERLSASVGLPEILLSDPDPAAQDAQDHADHAHGHGSRHHDHAERHGHSHDGHHPHEDHGKYRDHARHRDAGKHHDHGKRHDASHRHGEPHHHGHAHGEAVKDDHGHHHHDDDHDHAHMDGTVSWTYACEAPARLRHVEVVLFDLLPLDRIRVQAISERGQGAGNLTPASRRFTLP